VGIDFTSITFSLTVLVLILAAATLVIKSRELRELQVKSDQPLSS
jgi:hypothetical protein